jgi:tRNA pseudouridine38-40 synthase
MPKNFKIIIEYDGARFHGWQRQKDDRTIQQAIETALTTMTGGRVILNGSGRTDAGVHACGQTANCLCQTDLPAAVFHKGLNSILPGDIVIKDCRRVAEEFHARYDVKSKIYHYRIINRNIPPAIGRQYAWFIRRKLDPAAMRSAISHIIGSHDFKSFEGAGSPRSHTTRNIMAAELVEHEDGVLIFKIEADGFLRYMVRNIVGTLVDVGLGKISPAQFSDILAAQNRRKASATAPAHGLFLMEVKY